jgi:uncharacterized protein (DUF58 family)
MTFRFDPTELNQYGGISLVARSLVEGFLTGVHKSPYKGYSVEFAEHRQYYPGDEIRHIDWRVFGKTDRYYIKEFEEETNLKAYILLDASGSMGFRGKGRGAPSKFEHARLIAASLAYLMLHQLDAVGLVVHDTKVRTLIPPKANSKHLIRVLQTLEQAEPGGETSMAPIWHDLAGHQLKRRGLVVIVSDCFDDVDQLLLALRRFRFHRHEVLLFHVLAPEEMEFPYKRLTQFRNLELAADKMLVDPQRLRDEYLSNFRRFRERLREQAGRMQIDYHLIRTDDPVERALGVYLSRRQAQQR